MQKELSNLGVLTKEKSILSVDGKALSVGRKAVLFFLAFQEQNNMNNVDDITLSHLKDVHERLREKNGLFFQTPLIDCTQQLSQLVPNIKAVFLKLESMQCTG